MGFFDFLDDESSSVLANQPPPGSLGVSMSQTGSMMPTAQGKRGKKTRIAMHRIKPLTALDKGKLESLGKAGDPSLEDLERWGIKYEIDPIVGTQGNKGMGNPQDAMLQDKRDPNALQGDLGDIPKLLGPLNPGKLPGFNVTTNMKAREEASAKAAKEKTDRDAILKQQKGSGTNGLDEAFIGTPDVTGTSGLEEAGLTLPREDTIVGASEAAGVPEKDFNKAIAEIGQKLGLDLDEAVSFPLALQRLLNSSEFTDVRADFEMLGTAAAGGESMPAPKTGELALKDQGAGKGGEAKQPEQRNLYSEELGLLTKLAQTKDINTWYEAIAFVVLSMLIKPQMAILFFSRSSERGELKAQLVQNRRKQKMEQEAEEAAKERREWNRRTAIQAQLKSHESAVDDQRGLKQEIFKIMLRSSLTKQKPPKDETSKKIQEDIDNWLALAAKEAQMMNEDQARVYMKNAEALMERKRQYDAAQFGVTDETEE